MDVHLQAVEMRVLQRRENGGATVELPILRTATVDRGRTSGGGDGDLTVTRSVLEQIAKNFDPMGRPVPIGFGEHQDFGDRAGPAAGFVNSLRVAGDTLFAVISLSPGGAALVVDQEAFRGFSVEMGLDRDTPTGTLEGWSLHGGIFTNRPAVPIHFMPEGASAVAASVAFSIRPVEQARKDDGTMPENKADVSLESLQADLQTRDEKIARLEEALKSATESRDKATEDAAAVAQKLEAAEDAKRMAEAVAKAKGRTAEEFEERISKQDKQLAELTARLNEEKAEREKREVREKIQTAIYEGVAPKNFDGATGRDADPLEWLNEKFDGSMKALTTYIAALPRDEKLKERYAVSAGRPPAEADESVVIADLSDEDKALIESKGFTGAYLGVMTEKEARKRYEAQKAASAKE